MTDLRTQLQSTLGDGYTLERELGGGGMSRVFVARENALGRDVVVKVLAPELSAAVSAERFTREIATAARLQQANIVPVLAAGMSGGVPYYTMPFVKGESLRTLLARGTTWPLLKASVIDEAVLSPDGRWLVLRSGANGTVAGGRDITGVRTGADTARVPLIVTPFDEEAIALSPDGNWIAYQSDETGRTEAFVRAFPNTSAFKRQVSNGGGSAPLWSRDGRELFFVSPNADMMSARVTAGPPITIAAPAPLFHIADDLLKVEYAFYTPWDVAPDGRFIMARARAGTKGAATSVVIAENWLTELRARMKR